MMATIKNSIDGFGRLMSSASKVVLLLVAGTLCAALFTGHVDATLFEKALLLVLGFYFGKTDVSGSRESM